MEKSGDDGEPGTPGQPGPTGNGIVSITKTGTSGLIDTYTITYTNGTTTTFQVTNGEGGTTDYSDLDNQPSINGVTLLGNKTAEQLGITSSLCNLGKVEDYDQNNPLDLNKLSPGIYWLYRGSYMSVLYLKATYKGNEIFGQWNSGEYNEKKFVLLEIRNRVTDDLEERETIGNFTYFKLLTSEIKSKSSSIQISSSGITTNSGSETRINPVGLSNDQTITGKKTFNTLPESSVVPTTDNQLVNKKYVDDSIGDIETVLTTLTTGGGVNGNS